MLALSSPSLGDDCGVAGRTLSSAHGALQVWSGAQGLQAVLALGLVSLFTGFQPLLRSSCI